ncbi:major facilitator superfamily domain-containing protein [Suillus subalutaceus]|uniref:major facilitator superfamily domain-containing protein n=1 Tax=Suillus subalutaceus TaxID=48586 RepID=UPI001B884EB5|nr:major facilitator superfamily domain-containing protein [Suillus subalutaceus]KAG1860689.1 major facilitator superfamily domain-containing protein [Suillus subalutaceus]
MSIFNVQGSEIETSPLLHETLQKKQKTPLPKLQIGILMLVQLAEPIASMSIYPYINQLIRELDITGGNDATVGYYAGILESLFFITQALTVLKWSRLSDRIGRKPVLMIGLFGMGLSMLCFGLSTSFWTLVVSRSICGMLNGNSGVMKSMMGELTDSTNMAQGFALIPITWCFGGFFGFVMGGALARPQDRWPNLFAGQFWAKYPYFLPCAIAASVVFISFMFVFLLEETLATKRKRNIPSDTTGNQPLEEYRSDESPSENMANVPLRSLLTRSIIIPLANQAFLAFLDISIFALMPLFYSTPNYLGGLGFAPQTIGSWMALFGIIDGLFQALFFAKVVDRLGPKRTFYIGISCFIPIMVMFPVMSWLVFSRGVDYMVTNVLLCQLVLIVTWDMSLASIFMFVTASAPTKNVLGAVNGMGQTTVSIAHAVGPMFAASIFAFSKDHNILGGHAVYVVLCIPAVGMLWSASHLPEELQNRDEDE